MHHSPTLRQTCLDTDIVFRHCFWTFMAAFELFRPYFCFYSEAMKFATYQL
jgi:hypothetical protein